MRVAITGAEGQLGQTLARQLGAEALRLSRADLDMADVEAIARTLERLRPDVLINAAAYTNVERAEEETSLCWKINVEAVEQLATTCARLDCQLVHISTDYVFGGDRARRTPYVETDPPQPLSVYGRSKHAGELCAANCPRHLIVRTCGLYGTPVPRTSFVETMLRLGKERPMVRVVEDQVCTPSNVNDVAAAVLTLVRANSTGMYHVTNSGSTSWRKFAEAIFRLARLPVKVEPISSAEYGARAERPAYSVFDTARFAAVAGAPLRDWEAALADFLAARLRHYP